MRTIYYCPACGSHVTAPLLNLGDQPMSLVALTFDGDESASQRRLPINIHICGDCSHCFNADFIDVPYDGAGCMMWNNGSEWKDFVSSTAARINEMFAGNCDTVLEIGAGDCEFLKKLDDRFVKIAVDPAACIESGAGQGIHVVRDYFDPRDHLPAMAGDLVVVMRHLLEHMADPHDFMSRIARQRPYRFGRESTYVVVEVPNIENALNDTRLADWTYEHPQHFTRDSLRELMDRAGFDELTCAKGYNDEVLVYIGKTKEKIQHRVVQEFRDNFAKLDLMCTRVGGQVANMDSVAYWGGAGKSAMFLNYLGVPEDALVVDSDVNKIGMYVPGTTIQIQDPVKLLIDHVDTIIITTAWRAKDIAAEIKSRGIPYNHLLSFEGGQLVEVTCG